MPKPNNPLTALDSRRRPIFADQNRDYHYLAAIRSVRRLRNGVRIDLSDDDGNAVHLVITFLRPEVVRFQLFRDERPPGTTPMLVPQPSAPVDVEVSSDREAVTLSSNRLRIRAERDPWQLTVFDRRGREVCHQQRRDRAMMGFVGFPTGYSTDGNGDVAFHESLALAADEQLFGLGMQFGPFNKRGQRLVSWIQDTSGFTSSDVTYMNVPFFLSSRGYGVFVNHTSPITYELGSPSLQTAAFQVEDPYLDYFLIYGPGPKEILDRYTDLTGKSPLPPLWSFGMWMSRCRYATRAQVEEVVEGLRERSIPCDVINLDPRWLKETKIRVVPGCDFVWNDEDFPDRAGFVRWLSERGVKLCLWENPYIWEGTPMYEEGRKRGYLVRTKGGGLAQPVGYPYAGLPDFTNPQAVRWWQDKHRPLLRDGVLAFKPDYGDTVPEDALFADGRSGKEVHNAYMLLLNRATFDVIEQERGQGLVWARSGYAGSQRYPVNWTGDTPSSFDGMASAQRAGLSLSLSGIPFWGHDIGGFWPGGKVDALTPELYIRWAQFGLLSSHARFHGTSPREPWAHGEQAVAIVRKFTRLRYRLLPYLYALAQEACRTGVPVVRPMFVEYPDDPSAYHTELQYMLGHYLLVAPIFNEGGRCRFYLPPGSWYDFWTGERLEGPVHREVTAPLDRVPLFVRGDSILPLAPEMNFVGEKEWDPIRLDVRLEGRAEMTFPDPERQVRVRARRRGDEVSLDISRTRRTLAIRFLAPRRVKEVRTSGAATEEDRRVSKGVTVVSLKAGGRRTLTAVDAG
jgi:alpha-D-xyloside xylohydrolase